MTMLRRLILLLVAVVPCSLAACASAGTQGQSSSRSRNVITQEQLLATNSETLFDAITKLRPEWLTSRGPTSMTDPTPASVSVYMGGSMLGKADFLHQLRALDVTEVRYWDAGSASARFGMGHARGVIEITRK